MSLLTSIADDIKAALTAYIADNAIEATVERRWTTHKGRPELSTVTLITVVPLEINTEHISRASWAIGADIVVGIRAVCATEDQADALAELTEDLLQHLRGLTLALPVTAAETMPLVHRDSLETAKLWIGEIHLHLGQPQKAKP